MSSSIKIFQFYQKCHQIIGIYPSQSNQKQSSINWKNTIPLIAFAQMVPSTVAFIIFDAKSIFDYGIAFFVLIGLTACGIFHAIQIWQSRNTSRFIATCEEFIGKRVHSTMAYKELIEKIELFNKRFCVAIGVQVAILFFAGLPYSYVRYFILDLEDESFYLFFPIWMPFDWKTPYGYLPAYFSQCIGPTTSGFVFVQLFNLVFGSFWLFIFIAEDITKDLAAFNIITKTTASDGNYVELIVHFCDLAQIYSDAKQCVEKFNQVHEFSLFTFFLWDMLGMSSILVLLQFQLWDDDSYSFEIVLLFLVLTWMTVFILLPCEPGAKMTNQFEKFGKELSQCDWYSLSIKVQRMYAIFVSDTQNQVKIFSYGNITCERETFNKIINKAFSYFMTIRRLKP